MCLHFLDLPNELLCRIFAYVDFRDLYHCTLVSRSNRQEPSPCIDPTTDVYISSTSHHGFGRAAIQYGAGSQSGGLLGASFQWAISPVPSSTLETTPGRMEVFKVEQKVYH
jgi:hypothetical protein